MSEKIYVGNGKKKTFQDGGSVINIMLSLDGIKEHFENYGFTTDQGKKKLKLVLSERKEIDQYGNSHYLTVDTWKPEQQQPSNLDQKAIDEDDIPF